MRLSEWTRSPHRQWLLLALDTLCVAASFMAAYQIRFDGQVPADYAAQFRRLLPALLLIRIPIHVVFGIHRWSFRLSGLPEAVRLVAAGLVGSACFFAVPLLRHEIIVPRSVLVIEFFLTTSFIGGLRFSRRVTQPWLLQQRRARAHTRLERALIVGAGSAGDLLLRDLRRSGEHEYEVVGFADDNPSKIGTSIGGRPVLGRLEEIPAIVRAKGVDALLFAIPRLPPRRIREVLDRCAEFKLKYKILPVSFAYVNDQAGAARLAELAPEDLLAREQADFDPEEVRTRIAGRRVLVTGAAGSIGSEICRQLAQFGASQLVLADINENGLYFLSIDLQRNYPETAVAAEVVDIRDQTRLFALGRQYRPQYVFHAAAHKHVPLMETAPEEAVKNNVAGCRDVIEMAEDCGAERFVFVSTDKAVRPTSVMGASKKIAEMLVRERATRSKTAFSAVRFGNVLGSAGSVVPLFKDQIARGGPVTVTDPNVRRYLMTIREAVGLVLVAGLGGFGDLCILDMGEPIRIADLARMMIALCGLVPGQDVPIVFTGLRPGEKLDEELMTEEERSSSRSLARGFSVITTPPPSAELLDSVARLEAAARAGDREALFARLQEIVPDYVRDVSSRAGEARVP